MNTCTSYIDGRFLPADEQHLMPVINPQNELISGQISMAQISEAQRAVEVAHGAFESYSVTSLADRRRLMESLLAVYERRYEEMAQAISLEMGAPIDFASKSQAECGLGHMRTALEVFDSYPFERSIGNRAKLLAAPVGVTLLITPWNWPINQIFSKLAPALLCGCTVILKPSELAPYSAQLVAQFIDEAGYPPGVFNLIYGDGGVIGPVLCEAPQVDLISFTGSNATGAIVAGMAAKACKRSLQELGGKSPNIIFADADLSKAVSAGVQHCFSNVGQSCNAPTRMLVERSVYDRVVGIAIQAAQSIAINLPSIAGGHIGPLANSRQYQQFQNYLEIGLTEGARLVFGYQGRHRDFQSGYFVSPAIFTEVSPNMRIAREEVFGPLLVIIPFDGEDGAISMANDSEYGLAAYIQTGDHEKAKRVAQQIRAGSVHINGAYQDYDSPFGGFKKSGIGREWGEFGFHHFTEYQCINGYHEEGAVR